MDNAPKKVLLVNSNRYCSPPVVPIALEYLVHVLARSGFEAQVLDLCFAEQPKKVLGRKVRQFKPDAICVSIRNLDSGLYPQTEFFLPEIKDLIQDDRSLTAAPIVIGGAAITIDPQGILDFVRADLAVDGPGEKTLPKLLTDEDLLKQKGVVIQGESPDSFCADRKGPVDIKRYVDNGSIVGFETHKGCSSSCLFCIEANTPVCFKKKQDVIGELKQLAADGFVDMYLCDAEFNEDLGYCLSFLEGVVEEGLPLNWACYMKVGNYNERLFQLMKQSGAFNITLTVLSYLQDPFYWKQAEEMIVLAKQEGIRIVADIIVGLPGQDEGVIKQRLDFMRRVRPDEVDVNVFYRLYEKAEMTRRIKKERSFKKHLLFPLGDDGGYLSPVFFNNTSVEKVRELVGNNPLFRLMGEEKVVDYQRV